MSYNFIYDGVSSEQFGTYLASSNFMDGPDRDVTAVSIPGRNGNLIIDNGRYKNFPLEQHAYVKGNLVENMDALKNFLGQHQSSYYVMEESLSQDVFRMARVSEGFAMGAHGDTNGAFTIRYDCKPQRFLKSGTVPMQFILPIPGGAYIWKTPIIPVYNQTDLNFTFHCDPTDTPSVIVDKLDADDAILRSVTQTGHDGDDFTITFESDVVSWRITIDNRYSDTDPDLIRMEIRTTTVFDGKPIPVNARFGRTLWLQNPTGYEAKPLIEVFGNLLPSTDIENYEGSDKYSWFAFFVSSLGTDEDIQHFWLDCEMQYVYDDDGTNWTNKLTLTDYQHEMHNGLVFPFLGKDRIKLYWYGGTGGLGLINIYPRWWKL